MTLYIAICILSFCMSSICGFIIIPLILNFCKAKNLYDIPDSRKVHKNYIPRLGGVSFLPSMLLATVVALFVWSYAYGGKKIEISPWTIFFALGLFIIYAMGLVDDLLEVKAKTKLVIQIVAASLLPMSWLYINNLYGFCGIHEIPFSIGAPLTVLLLVFIMNAINLIDGIDGLSSSLTFIALAGFLYCFFKEELWIYCILISGLMGIILSFFYFNVFGKAEKNRKIFMGDSGSLTIGYILGVLLVKFCMDNPNIMDYHHESIFLSFTLLLIPVFDVLRVIVARIKHKQGIFQPDKNHIHHKLMRAGFTQHQTLGIIVLMALFFIVFNTTLFESIDITVLILIDIILYALMDLLIINRLIKKQGNLPFIKNNC